MPAKPKSKATLVPLSVQHRAPQHSPVPTLNRSCLSWEYVFLSRLLCRHVSASLELVPRSFVSFSWEFGLLMLHVLDAGRSGKVLCCHQCTWRDLHTSCVPQCPQLLQPRRPQRLTLSEGSAEPGWAEHPLGTAGGRDTHPRVLQQGPPNHPGLPSSPSPSPQHLLSCSCSSPEQRDGSRYIPAGVTSHQVPGRINIAGARPETAPERGDSQGESGA